MGERERALGPDAAAGAQPPRRLEPRLPPGHRHPSGQRGAACLHAGKKQARGTWHVQFSKHGFWWWLFLVHVLLFCEKRVQKRNTLLREGCLRLLEGTLYSTCTVGLLSLCDPSRCDVFHS